MGEIVLECDLCEQVWAVTVTNGNEKTIKAIAGLTGYCCKECAGEDPTTGRFRARKIENPDSDS